MSDEEAAYIDLKVRLATSLREQRQRRRLTQAGLAKLLRSSQSRVAKMGAGDPAVSLDRLIRATGPWYITPRTVSDDLNSLARASGIDMMTSAR